MYILNKNIFNLTWFSWLMKNERSYKGDGPISHNSLQWLYNCLDSIQGRIKLLQSKTSTRERERQNAKEDILQKLLTMNNTVPQFSKSSLCNPLQILDYSQQQRSSKCRPSSFTELITSHCHELQHQT